MNSQKPDRIYLKETYIREFEFPNGGTILNTTIDVEDFNLFAKEYAHEGKVRLIIERKKNQTPGGTTHSARLDTWKPSGQPRQQQQSPRTQGGGVDFKKMLHKKEQPQLALPGAQQPPDDDIVPF